MLKFNIVVPLYNAEKYIGRCLKTIKAQKYENLEVVVVNDVSSDNSKEIVTQEIAGFDNFHLINTNENGGPLSSLIKGINYLDPEKEDVVVVVDGDDWLATPNVLNTLEEAYLNNNCLMTFGSYIEYPSGKKGKFSRKIPDEVIKNKSYRKSEWMTSHLRTFKCKLFRMIREEDLGNFEQKYFKRAGDVAAMFPMLEMAEERALFIDEILYVYNRNNPLNEDKVDHMQQLAVEHEVRNKPVYPRLEEIIRMGE